MKDTIEKKPLYKGFTLRSFLYYATLEPPNKGTLGQGVLSFIERFPLFGG